MIVAAGVFFGLNHPTGFPWLTVLLCGVILSATDPVAIVALFKQLGAPDDLTALLEGESLFNFDTALVMFTVLVAAATSGAKVQLSTAGLTFVTRFFGGVAEGSLCGICGAGLYKFFHTPTLRALITAISGALAFFLAERLLHVSGVVALLLAVLILGGHHRRQAATDGFAGEPRGLAAYCCNALSFFVGWGSR